MSEIVLSRLQEQEQAIERGLASFVEVGNALMKIRDEELYREVGFDGFVEYLESKPWGIGQREAYYQIEAAEVCTIVQTPIVESHARALAPLRKKATPEVVKQVYADVVEETQGRPTASAISKKVADVLPRTPSDGHADPSLINEAIHLLDTFNKLASKITPELLGRISQSVCKRYESRASVAETHLSNQRAELRPRLDSLTPTRRG